MLVLFWLALLAADMATGLAGPYVLVMHKVDECEKTGRHEMIFDFNYKSINKTTLSFKGRAVLPYGMSDKIQVILHGGPYSSGEVEDIFVKNFGRMCTAIKQYAPEIARDVFKALGYPPTECPKKGNYSFDFDLPFKFTGIPVLPYGKFRFNADFLLANGAKIGCIYAVADVLPKKFGKKHIIGK